MDKKASTTMSDLEQKMHTMLLKSLRENGLNLLQAQIQLRNKYTDAIEQAATKIRTDFENGDLK